MVMSLYDSALLTSEERGKKKSKRSEPLPQPVITATPIPRSEEVSAGRELHRLVLARTKYYQENPGVAERFLTFVKGIDLSQGVGPSKALRMGVPRRADPLVEFFRTAERLVATAYGMLESDAIPTPSVAEKATVFVAKVERSAAEMR